MLLIYLYRYLCISIYGTLYDKKDLSTYIPKYVNCKVHMYINVFLIFVELLKIPEIDGN